MHTTLRNSFQIDDTMGRMMSNAHILAGVATALTLAQTGSIESCTAAVIGGSIGGIIADCDITSSHAHRDALRGRIVVGGLAAIALLVDSQTNVGLCNYLISHLGVLPITGLLLFATLTFVGRLTDHRSFTHSLIALAAFTFAVVLACQPLAPYFAMGYASHLVLDALNKQPIKLFFPFRKGVAFGICKSNGSASLLIQGVSALAIAALIAVKFTPLF